MKLPIGLTLNNAWQKVYGFKKPLWGGFGYIILIYAIWAVLNVLFVAGFAAAAGVPIEEFNKNPTLTYHIVNISFFVVFQILLNVMNAGLMLMAIRRVVDLPVKASGVFIAFKDSRFWKVIGTLILVDFFVFIPILVMALLPDAHPAATTSGDAAATSVTQVAEQVTSVFSDIQALATAVVIILCLIIAAVLIVRFMLAIPAVMDRKLNPWQAIKCSFIATRGNFWRLVFIVIIQACFMIAGFITLGIALIWLLPYMMNIAGEVYKQLVGVESVS